MSGPDRVRISFDSTGASIPVGETFRQTSADGGKTWHPPLPQPPAHVFEDLIEGSEDTLHGLVCDQLDRANPDLPIETCQVIARDIIRLVREYS